MCFSYPDTTPELGTRTQSRLSDGPTWVAHGLNHELIRAQTASGLPPTETTPPGASAFLPSTPAGPQIRTCPQRFSGFHTQPASSTFHITQNLPTSCHLHNFHHLVSGPMPPGLQDPAPPIGCSSQGRQRAPVNAASGPAPFCSGATLQNPTRLRAKSPAPSRPRDPVNLPPSPTCPPFTATLAPSLFPESHSHLGEGVPSLPDMLFP